MTNWKTTVKIKHLLTDDDTPEYAREVGEQVAGILRGSAWFMHSSDYVQDEIEQIADEFSDVSGTSHFNAVLDALYDLADAERVWIG